MYVFFFNQATATPPYSTLLMNILEQCTFATRLSNVRGKGDSRCL